MALFLSPTFATSFNKKTMRKSMITLNRKWIRLIGIVGCTMCLASCKQASDASGMKPSYATMKVEATDKELSTSYSATIRGRQDIDIYPQVSGTIEKLCVTEDTITECMHLTLYVWQAHQMRKLIPTLMAS